MARLELLEPGIIVHGLGDGPVTIRNAFFYGSDLVFVTYVDALGAETHEFLDRPVEKKLRLEREAWRRGLPWDAPYRFYPTRVPRLFQSMSELAPILSRTRRQHRLHSVAQAYIAEVASRLSSQMVTVREIHAVAGARNDGLSVGPWEGILWEVFATPDRIDEDLRKLERDESPRRLKVAIVLDAEVDSDLFEKFIRKLQGSSVSTWLRLSDLMLEGRFAHTVRQLNHKLDELLPNDWPDQLRLVAFDLAEGHSLWCHAQNLPFGYNGLSGHLFGGPLEDPTFFLDVQNIGQREARIGTAYVNVRFKQLKLHGIADGKLLSPACTIALPLNNGEPGYREVALPAPVLVPPGRHARMLIRLENAGYSWRGEVEVGLRYGPQKVLRAPAISVFR
jgi:hypothetical protein